MTEWRETELGRIPQHWGLDTLGGISSLITDGSHRSPNQVNSNYLMPSVKDMTYDKFDFTNCKTISEKDFLDLLRSNCSPQKGDIIISKDGANCLDLIFVYNHDEQVVLLSSLAIVRLKENYSPDFFRYYLLSPNAQYLMRNNLISGSAIPRVVLKDLKNVLVPTPDYIVQRAIASVLRSLDAKIDLLQRQNKTLEAMAETLFRQWFVEEAEEGWEEVLLGDLIDVRYGKDHKALAEGRIPVYGSGGTMRYADRSLFEGESVLIPRKGSLNNVMYVNEAFWTVDTMFYTVMKRPNMAKFIYHFMKAQDLASMNVGSAVPSMTTAVLNNMPLEIPAPHVFERYEKTVRPLYEKQAFNTKQIQNLTALRDTLLPKLMSGEVRVEQLQHA